MIHNILLSNEFINYYNTNEYVFTSEAKSEGVYYLKTSMMEINIKQWGLRKILDNNYYYRNGFSGITHLYTY